MAKAKKATKTTRATKAGRRRTGIKRTKKRTTTAVKRRTTAAERRATAAERRTGAIRARKRASAATSRAGRSRGGDLATPGPSLPLRDLIRGGGLPRSRKAHHPPGKVTTSPWASRRTRTASGLRSGAMILQNQPNRLEHVGSLRIAIPKR